jgi:hypothetical protein
MFYTNRRKSMRVSPPVKNLAWLLGSLFFLLAAFYPPLPMPILSAYTPYGGWMYNFFQIGAAGGPGWILFSALPHWHTLTRTFLIYELAPYCFIPVVLPLCALLSWKFLVYRANRPTLLRGLMAVVLASVLSLIGVFLLDWIGGRVYLTLFPASPLGALTARGLISQAWYNAIAQSALLLLPCLVIGGALAFWQERLWRRFME